MGLDMYINKVKKTNHSISELIALNVDAHPDNVKVAEFLPLSHPYPEDAHDYYTIFHQVAYWRKFNALHGWFVNNLQLGIDNCADYELNKDILLDLLEVLEETWALKNPAKLPPTLGYFWGSTETDDYYWDKVYNSIQTISELIDDTDWKNERLFYTSSW